MDILKRAYANLSTCKVSKDTVEVCGKTYSPETHIAFSTPKSKEYSLDSVLFFLLNSNTPLAEYVERRQKVGIIPVSYLDHASIREDINSFKEFIVPGFFIRPIYITNKTYAVPDIRESYRIIVSNDISSIVNINNISALLIDGFLMKNMSDPFSNITVDLTVENLNFKISNNPEGFTEDDWAQVKGVFLDDTDYMLNLLNLPKLSKSSGIFTLSDRPFKSTRLIFENDKLKNHKDIINEIKEKIFN